MKKRIYLLLVVMLISSALLAACSGGNNAGNNPSNTPNQPANDISDNAADTGGEAGGIVEYWSMFNVGEPLQVYLDEAFKQFESETGIKVNVTWSGREVITTLRGSLLSGDVPDLVDQSNSELTAGLVSNDLAASLDEYLATNAYNSEEKWGETFVSNVLGEMKHSDDKTYIIPRDVYTSGFFYSASKFEKLGITPPATWEEFLQVCETLKENGIAPLAADGNIQFYNVWYFMWLAMREVGPEKLYEAAADETGELWKSEPGFLEAAKKLHTLVENDYFAKGYEGSAFPAGQVNWVNGNAGMILVGAWLPKEMEAQTPEGFDMQMFAFPNTGGFDPTIAETWVNGYLMLKDGKNHAGTIELLKFLSSKEQMSKMVELGSPGPLKGLETPVSLNAQTEILEGASQVVPKWGGLERDFAELNKRVIWMANDQLFFGKIAPEQFIKTLAAEQKKYYANK